VSVQKLKQALEIASNVTVIIAAGALVIALVIARHRAQETSEVTQAKEIAQLRLSLPSLEQPDGKHKVLLIAMSTTCSFCKASIPFYKRLESRVSSAAKVVAVFPQSDAEVQQYEKQEGLSLPFKSNIQFDRMGVVGTPTVILVDQWGHPQRTWMGLLKQGDEAEIEKNIGL
jgi:thiol-disulfide isomerase/thioredoxin